ncbi:MAG: TIGR04282 family arsenosugar biosynthesis glycosyltransferase [Candidatus Eisenbacteria bacterium]
MKKRIAVFARQPLPGRVKTRLSPALPPELACDLYAAMLDDTLESVRAARAETRTVFWADVPEDNRSPEGFFWHAQKGADLGARLADAFDTLLVDGAHAVVVGSDCPGLTTVLLERALDALDRADLVLGPAADGGYWLVGLARPAPQLFTAMPWSTEAVFTMTVARAAESGLSVETLPLLDDLDTPDHLARLVAGAALGRQNVAGPKLLAALRAMKLLPA